MTNKRTKRDNFMDLMAVINGSKELKAWEVTVLNEFISHELELLDRKHTPSANSAVAKRKADNVGYQDIILEILSLADEPLTIKGIQSLADEPINGFSTSKMSALLTALKKADKVVRTEVKKVVYWEAVKPAAVVEDTAEGETDTTEVELETADNVNEGA